MTREEYLEFCKGLKNAEIDYPFKNNKTEFINETTIVRHSDNRKWFAAIMMIVEGEVFVNLKCEPLKADLLRSAYNGIKPAYHMNKKHWISVYLDSDVPRDMIEVLTMESYELTKNKRTA